MIDSTDRSRLLARARQAIAAALGAGAPPDVSGAGALARRAGAFVTLHLNGELRGCIGHITPDRPLAEVVASCAVSAARADPRFAPLTISELAGAVIEVSVLSGFEPIHSLDQIEIGRHGLLVEQRWSRGLLLPQVAPEWGWDVPTFVQQTCRKAGLPPDAWPDGGATMMRFEAEVFAEAVRL